MKFLFIVQGEGRGHLTQAITLENILLRNGHEVDVLLWYQLSLFLYNPKVILIGLYYLQLLILSI